MTARLIAVCALALVLGCGKADKKCGKGTTAVAGVCVAVVNACGPGLVLVEGQCVPPPGPTDGGTCVPECAGRDCGPDGCGGSCGPCASPMMCTEAGRCLEPEGVPDGGGCTPSCDGVECGDDGCGAFCGQCNDPARPVCGFDGMCVSVCVPNCIDAECGPDGCGGSCGTCASDNACSAEARCVPTGWTCDSGLFRDGHACDCACGAVDPDCTPGRPVSGCNLHETCSPAGECVSEVPVAWTCGDGHYDDGLTCDCNCGARDPDCDQGRPVAGCGPGVTTCGADGRCGSCTPHCGAAECGDDGCGGSCGTCSSDPSRPVCYGGRCVNPCAPTPLLCFSRSCGADGCGGSCGTCGSGLTCEAGTCVTSSSAAAASCFQRCGSSAPAGCSCTSGCTPPAHALPGDPNVCCDDFTQQCTCVPSCGGRQCGSDGCGGSCGTCSASARHCTPEGQCTATCQPKCTGKSCGPDGCGGSCGTCASGQACSALGKCVPPGWTCMPTAYADGTSCDCGCGAVDPDCANASNPVYNCPPGATCSASALCDIAQPCSTDDECGGGRWCLGAYRSATQTLRWTGACGAPVPFADPPGTSCISSENCATRLCVAGLCRTHCRGDGDCPGTAACVALGLQTFAGAPNGGVAVCDSPTGSKTPCARQTDCENGELCAPFPSPDTGAPRYLCIRPEAGAVQLGGDCSRLACATGLTCAGPSSARRCLRYCPGGNLDCQAGQSCLSQPYDPTGAFASASASPPQVPACAP